MMTYPYIPDRSPKRNLSVLKLIGPCIGFLLLLPLAAHALTYEEFLSQSKMKDQPPAPGYHANYEIYLAENAKQGLSPKLDPYKWSLMQPWQHQQEIEKATRGGKTANQKLVEDQLNNRTPTECTWYNWPVRPIQCIVVPLMSWAGGLFMAIAGYILQIVSYVFNTLVKWFIVDFGRTIESLGLLPGIHTAWEILRDISNIVIIGMFVFIAISMIIGSETFGQKKFVAHVLVIAVLINFSLLFSKLVIDAGNFTAYQIYKGMGGQNTDVDIAGKFLAVVGITGAWDSLKLTEEFANSTQKAGVRESGDTTINNIKAGFKGLMYGIVGGVLLLTAAVVLLYGCFLIVTRAVLLVFLMLVSALAFASWLVPKVGTSSYGFSTWWKSLINASVFAPLLMILLYVSLLILTPAAAHRGEGTLASLSREPENISRYWQTLVLFIFGVGMLYISFRVANTFSNQISGFSVAGKAVGRTTGLAAGLAGLAGRLTVGNLSARLAQTRLYTMGGPLGNLIRAGLGAGATGSFDARRFPGVASGAKYGGIDLGKAKGEGGYVKSVADAEKRIAEREAGLRKLTMTKSGADIRKERELLAIQKQMEDNEKEIARRGGGETTPPQQAQQQPVQTQAAKAPVASQRQYADTTERDAQDALRQQAQTSAAEKAEGRIATDAEAARIARIAGRIDEERAKALARSYIAEREGSGSTIESDKNRRVVEELRRVNENLRRQADTIRADLTRTGTEARGARFDRAIENKYYFSFPLDFAGDRSAVRAAEIRKLAGKTDLEKMIERWGAAVKESGEKSAQAAQSAKAIAEKVEQAITPPEKK